jgi:Ser-tRNA(Ala) deacylase AlaX
MFKKGEVVGLTVDQTRRIFNSPNHTAGHMIDLAIKNLGYTFTAGKGYHFHDGAYVE